MCGAICALLLIFFFETPTSSESLNEKSEAKSSVQTAANSQAHGVLLIFVRKFSFDTNVDDIDQEESFVSCVREALIEARPSQRLVTFEDYHQTIFPHLKRRSVPRDPEYIVELRASADFRRGMSSLGIRYIAFVGGVAEIGPASGAGDCFGGYGGAGCFGYWEWKTASHAGASILDLIGERAMGSVEATATGTARLAIVGIIPLGLPSTPRVVACRRLGENIAGYLSRREDK